MILLRLTVPHILLSLGEILMAILLMHQIIKEAGIFKILWKKIILLQWMWERHLSTRRVQTVPRSQALVSFKKYMPPPPTSSLLQGKHLPFSPSPLCLNIFRLFVILSLTQLYRYTPEIFLFRTATFKYTYRAPL